MLCKIWTRFPLRTISQSSHTTARTAKTRKSKSSRIPGQNFCNWGVKKKYRCVFRAIRVSAGTPTLFEAASQNLKSLLQASADHTLRPILVPRNITYLPWNTGYAETINAGKSQRNEDQGTFVTAAISTLKGCAQILENATQNELEQHLDLCQDCIPYR